MSAPVIVYEDDLVQLWHGDYRDRLEELKAARPDAIVTDPPYEETTLEWDRWVDGWLIDAALISDALWCFGSFRMFQEHAAEFAAWRLSQDVVWEKHNGSSLAADRFRRVHELAVLWYRGEWSKLHHQVPTTPDATPRAVRRKAKPPQHQGSAARATTCRRMVAPASCGQCLPSGLSMVARFTRRRSRSGSSRH